MPNSSEEYKPLSDDRYAIQVAQTSTRCGLGGPAGLQHLQRLGLPCRGSDRFTEVEVHAYYRGSLPRFQIFREVPIRRGLSDGKIISVPYSERPGMRRISILLLIVGLILLKGGHDDGYSDAEVAGISTLAGGVALLLLALTLTRHSRKNAIASLEDQVRRKIDAIEGYHSSMNTDQTSSPSNV